MIGLAGDDHKANVMRRFTFAFFLFTFAIMRAWQTSRRTIRLDRPLVMGILNVTPDSFSDGGRFDNVDAALHRAEKMVSEGADLIDIGGESTRPGSERVGPAEETARVVPVIEAICSRFDVPVSIDTSRADVARAASEAGAEIINDISGLRWDAEIAGVAATFGAGLILMHSRGDFETMHSLPHVESIIDEVVSGLKISVETANSHGVSGQNIALDIGIGFGKSPEQNIELIARLRVLIAELGDYPMLVGASRKSFVGKILGDIPPDERLGGSLAAAAIAVWNGANLVRCHDVRETIQAIRVASELRRYSSTHIGKME